MKRFIALFCAILLLLSFVVGSLSSCWNDGEKDPPDDAFVGYGDDFRIIREMTMNEERHLLVFNYTENLSFEELVIAQAIQGLYARTNAKYYCWSSGSYEIWLQDMVENYGFTYDYVTLEEMVKSYIEDYGNKYVLYDRATLPESVNSACSIAGVTGFLPVDKKIKSKMESYGLEIKIDASAMTERTCFDLYKDSFNTDGLVQQSPNNVRLRDWAVACGYFIFFREGTDSKELMFRGEVHDWVDEDAAMYGWVPNDEGQDVTVASQYGQFTIASDHSLNTTVFACKNAFGEANFTQSAKETGIVAEDGKHYVCIMMSDGDNVQVWYNSFPFDDRYFGAERDNSFPMGWSIQPALLELGPNILNYVKRNSGPSDYYVCSVSGIGYIYPQVYPTMDTYTKALSAYMRRADLSVIQILDSGPSDEVIEAYAQIPELKGGIYCYGEKYAAGNGSIYWANGKPFISIRETLWNANVEAMAERINSYSRDPSSVDGYTAINVHPWSMTYEDVVKLVSLLDDDVVIVTADDFIRLITENVPHEDVVK
ncbi:MAG: hypothetical protein IJW61_00550 [Clostridia bacterium]|nr:hypothetical protein [Clostridia bacterium]